MKPVSMLWVALSPALLLVLAGALTACAYARTLTDSSQTSLPESQQMEKETYLGTNTTIKTAVVGSVTVGYASRSDYENRKHPVSPTVTLLPGGSITHTLTITNGSKVRILGGQIGYREHNVYGGEVLAGDKSTVVFSGGTAHSLSATQQSTVTITGGTIISSLIVGEEGTLNLKGGTVKGDISVGPGGAFNVFGANLSKRLLRPDESGYFVAYADQADQYVLSGTLSNGTVLKNKILLVSKDGDSKINLIRSSVHH